MNYTRMHKNNASLNSYDEKRNSFKLQNVEKLIKSEDSDYEFAYEVCKKYKKVLDKLS